ncbi:MAG: YbjN domain-containing protein [Pseudomonadota bacterium]
MTFVHINDEQRHSNPVDVIEAIAGFNDWAFERSTDDEITIAVVGRWSEYNVSFSWMDEVESLHLACGFELAFKSERNQEILRLLALINEQMWAGHFEWWRKDNLVIFRHTLPLAGGVEPATRQVEAMLENALVSCEQYFQAFQFVLWAGNDAKDALAAAMFETKGEA